MKKLLGVCLAVTALSMGCGSDDDKEDGAGSCSLDPDADITATAVTKEQSSDADCPNLTPDDLNGPDEDAGADDDCDPVINKAECSLSVDCTDSDGTKIKGSFAPDGDVVKGMLTVEVGDVSCTYSITWK